MDLQIIDVTEQVKGVQFSLKIVSQKNDKVLCVQVEFLFYPVLDHHIEIQPSFIE